METVVFCKKYQEELPAMSFPPLPGPAGRELLETVSQKAAGLRVMWSFYLFIGGGIGDMNW